MDKSKAHNQNETVDNQVEETVQDEQAAQTHDNCELKLVEMEGRYKRALADYQNLEKRIRDERGEIIRSANREIILRFLPIFDTLELAQQHDTNQTLKVVASQFSDILKAEGAVRIKTVGEKFDPMTMEVVSAGEGKEGVVIQEVRSGYLLHDKLLRPAQVIVGQGKSKDSN